VTFLLQKIVLRSTGKRNDCNTAKLKDDELGKRNEGRKLHGFVVAERKAGGKQLILIMPLLSVQNYQGAEDVI
jgi:hypothetical protein